MGVMGGSSVSMYGLYANSNLDMSSKVRDDPLLAFRRQEKAALEAMMKNPMAMKNLKEKKSKKKSSRSRSRSREKSKRERSRSRERYSRDDDRSYDRKRDDRDSYDRKRDDRDRYESRRDDRDSYDRKRDDYRRDDYKRDDYKTDDYKRDDYKRDDYKRDDYKRDDYKRYDYEREDSQPQKSAQEKLEAMKRNAQTMVQERTARIDQEREHENRAAGLVKNQDEFSTMLSKSVYESGSASDMIQRNKGLSMKR